MPTYTWNGVSWDVLPTSVSPGTLVEISRQVVTTAVAAVDFKTGIDSTYDEYELHWYDVRMAADGPLSLRISQDGGATFKAGANDYPYGVTFLSFSSAQSSFTGSGVTGLSLIQLTGTIVSASTTVLSAGKLTFFTPSGTTQRKAFLMDAFFSSPTGGYNAWKGFGTYLADTNAYNGIRLFNGVTGNITGGTFVLYGVSKTAVVPGTSAAGSRVLIRSQTISTAVASVDFTTGIDAAYDEYELVMRSVKVASDGAIMMRISQDGGATFKAGGTDYAWSAAVPAATGSAYSPGTGNGMLVSSQHLATSTVPLVSVLKFHEPSNAAIRKPFLVHGYQNNPLNGHSSWIGHALYVTDNGAINGLRIMNAAGSNLTAGTFSLYGMKK